MLVFVTTLPDETKNQSTTPRAGTFFTPCLTLAQTLTAIDKEGLGVERVQKHTCAYCRDGHGTVIPVVRSVFAPKGPSSVSLKVTISIADQWHQ